MIKVEKHILGSLSTCCYIVYDDITNDGVIIDCACEGEFLLSRVNTLKINLKAVLLTHGHFDHIGACAYFKNKGFKIAIHKDDKQKCLDNKFNLSIDFKNANINVFTPYIIWQSDLEFNFGSLVGKVLHTPGHSAGSVCYVIGNYIFSGDTMFNFGYGRTDFYDGSALKLRQSLKKIKTYLDIGYVLMPGH